MKTPKEKIEQADEYGKILNDYIISVYEDRPFIGNIGILKVMDEMKKDFEQQLIALGKELLKGEIDARFEDTGDLVPISHIVKCFDTLGINLESKTEF
jgi:hypothetical protein